MARSRNRDYRAEYARRIARGRSLGRSRQASRGHAVAAPGKTEYAARAERTRAKYGAAPNMLTELRRRAGDHIVHELTIVGTRHHINRRTINIGMRMLHAETLHTILTMEGTGMKIMASLDYGSVYDHEVMAYENPDESNQRNPLWYG